MDMAKWTPLNAGYDDVDDDGVDDDDDE